MTLAVVFIPLVAAAAMLALRSARRVRGGMVVVAGAHLAVTLWLWYRPEVYAADTWFYLDPLGQVFLLIISVLFLGVTVSSGNLWSAGVHPGPLDRTMSPAVFGGCMLLFLGAMSWVCISQHLGLLWVGVEATTLASTPLIAFHRRASALEATWKYLLICSVGIALALVGNILLVVAVHAGQVGDTVTLTFESLRRHAHGMAGPHLKTAFVFLLVGYGTKMGLAPLHTWLPDAHSEAPAPVSALLSGALLNCAFLGILRVYAVCQAAGASVFAGQTLVALGLMSLLVAAIFIVHQHDYKRLLAYSSVEHMGILAIGLGVGGGALFGILFHAVNHGLTKAALFLTAGNILGTYGTKDMASVTGLRRRLPVTGALWLAGFLAICGTPPFGTFFSEWLILKAALLGSRWVVGGAVLVLLALIFVGMARYVFQMTLGDPARSNGREHESLWTVCTPILFLVMALALGLFLPEPLRRLLESAVQLIGGGE